MRVVRIEWEGPYAFADVLALNDEERDYGVYQIYGEHVVFGEGTLLYIGIARDQTFGRRLSQHDWIEEDNEIVVGRIAESDYKHDRPDWSDWHELLGDVEALEIFWHSPPYNSKYLRGYHGRPLILINEGERVRLSACCESDEMPYYIESAYIDESRRVVSTENRMVGVRLIIRCYDKELYYKTLCYYKERSAHLPLEPVF